MKILYVISTTDMGGAEKALLSLSQRMVQNGHIVKVLSLRSKGPIAHLLEKAGVEVVSYAERKSREGSIRWITQNIQDFQPDIVHAMLLRAIEYTRLACQNLSIHLVTTPHFDLSKKNFLFRTADRFLKGVDTVTVAESQTNKKYLVDKQKYSKEKTIYIGNSPPTGSFFPDINIRQEMRQKWGFTDEEVVFITVARLSVEKNHSSLLEAFAQVYKKRPFVRLVLVGKGAEEFKLKQLVKKEKIEDVVLFAGEQENVQPWLNLADCFVLVSNAELLPLSLLEALQAGLPCIVSNKGDMPLWVNNGKNGFVLNSKDKTLLSCFLSEVADNPDLRKKMATASLEKTKEIKNDFQCYQQLYQQVMEGSFHVKTFN